MNPTARPFGSTRIILGVMALGVLAFTAVAAYLRATMQIGDDRSVPTLLAYVLVGLALSEVPAYFVLRKVFFERARQQREEALEALRQGLVPLPLATFLILAAALIEGPGLFGAVILILGAPWAVIAAPILSVGLIVLHLPTREGLEAIVRGA